MRALGQRGERGLIVFDLEQVVAAFFHYDAGLLAGGLEGFADASLFAARRFSF